MIRNIECKECQKTFEYDVDIEELRGGRKRYCNDCKELRKFIQTRECKRKKYTITNTDNRQHKASKTSVIKYALKYISDLYITLGKELKSKELYDKVEEILPSNYAERSVIRRCYKEL